MYMNTFIKMCVHVHVYVHKYYDYSCHLLEFLLFIDLYRTLMFSFIYLWLSIVYSFYLCLLFVVLFSSIAVSHPIEVLCIPKMQQGVSMA